ncbi:hypothetical protein [Kribbella sp. NPDC050470]|uniref:hypothetical protein n=1 Tax=unclassified Kribbella TaxID=2644121 RepID=UPI0037A02E22
MKRAVSVAAAAVLLGALTTAPAEAASTAACEMSVGSINANGDRAHATVTASTPPTVKQRTGQHMFTPGAAKLSTTWTYTVLNPVGYYDSAYVVLGSSLYKATYGVNTDGKPINAVTRVGGGWENFIAVEESFSWGPTIRFAKYGLRNDGVLFRWTDGFKKVSSYAGFSAVKTMALISETATYDTFLATTRGGALYTIRIPVGSAKPVVKQVRSSTWQGFEHLVAEKCGTQSTLLTAIDKDTGSAYLYAVGHANGTSTVIKGLGKVPGTYTDPVYNLDTAEGNAPLFGE